MSISREAEALLAWIAVVDGITGGDIRVGTSFINKELIDVGYIDAHTYCVTDAGRDYLAAREGEVVVAEGKAHYDFGTLLIGEYDVYRNLVDRIKREEGKRIQLIIRELP